MVKILKMGHFILKLKFTESHVGGTVQWTNRWIPRRCGEQSESPPTNAPLSAHAHMFDVAQTLIVLKILKPVRAVVRSTPGSCGCQWISFTSCCPWWINSNCGGIPGGVASESSAPPILSVSTERSHWTTWLSSTEEAKKVLSVGCHSREVMGPEWMWPLVLPCKYFKIEGGKHKISKI